MPDQYYQEYRKLIQSKAGGEVENTDIIWAIADVAASVVDGATNLPIGGAVNQYVQNLHSLATATNGMLPNPWFVWNGQDDAESPITKRYLKQRSYLKWGSAGVAVTGAATAGEFQVDAIGALQHGNAAASTTAHLVKFRAIAKSHKKSETISGWIDLLMKLKGIKAGVRGGQMATALVPVPFGGATAISITAATLAAGAKLGVKMRYGTICNITAIDLHWRAFQEQAILGGRGGSGPATRILGGRGGTGPATRILDELFTRRGATRIFGKHNVKGIIQEPAGWKALADKLLLI